MSEQSVDTTAREGRGTVSLDDETNVAPEAPEHAQETLPLAPPAHAAGSPDAGVDSVEVSTTSDPHLSADIDVHDPTSAAEVPLTADVPPAEPVLVESLDNLVPDEPIVEVDTPYFGPVGKRRSPAVVLILSVITFGLYGLVWHNRTNRELGDFDPQMNVHAGRSALAVTIAWLIGLAVTLAGAARIGISAAGLNLPFDPGFSVHQAYALLAGLLVVPYLTLLIPFAFGAVLMTAERIRIVEEHVGFTTDVQIQPPRIVCWLLVPLVGPLMLIGKEQARVNATWDRILPPPGRRRK